MNSNSGEPDGESTGPRVAPLQSGVTCPLWSLMIPTFNCAKYLRETSESVLVRDPGPEQVADACSHKDDRGRGRKRDRAGAAYYNPFPTHRPNREALEKTGYSERYWWQKSASFSFRA